MIERRYAVRLRAHGLRHDLHDAPGHPGPLGAIPIFLSLTSRQTPPERAASARQATFVSFGVIVLFAVFGRYILKFLGISVPALQVAGGLLLLLVALELLTDKADESPDPDAVTSNAALVPLGTPLLAGPGAIVAAMVAVDATGGGVAGWVSVTAAIIATHIAIWVALRFSLGLNRVLGTSGIRILTRVIGTATGGDRRPDHGRRRLRLPGDPPLALARRRWSDLLAGRPVDRATTSSALAGALTTRCRLALGRASGAGALAALGVPAAATPTAVIASTAPALPPGLFAGALAGLAQVLDLLGVQALQGALVAGEAAGDSLGDGQVGEEVLAGVVGLHRLLNG